MRTLEAGQKTLLMVEAQHQHRNRVDLRDAIVWPLNIIQTMSIISIKTSLKTF